MLFVGVAIGLTLNRCNKEAQVVEVSDKTTEAKLNTILNNSMQAEKKAMEKVEVLISEVYVLNQDIKSKDQEIKRLKKGFYGIIYKTNFDSSATIDTVKIELAKADSANKEAKVIIKKQDSAIADRDTVIQKNAETIETLMDAVAEGENQQAILELDLKQQKKKLTKVKTNNTIKTGLIIALNIASIASPPTAMLTTGASIIIAIIPFNRKTK